MAGTSVHYDCLTSAKATIDALSLSGLTTVVRMLPRERNEVSPSLPMCVVAPSSKNELQIEFGQLTNTDEVGYPIYVVLLADANNDLSSNLETWLGWRQSIQRALRWDADNWVSPPSELQRIIPSDEEVILDDDTLLDDLFYSPMLFYAVSRETRGSP